MHRFYRDSLYLHQLKQKIQEIVYWLTRASSLVLWDGMIVVSFYSLYVFAWHNSIKIMYI